MRDQELPPFPALISALFRGSRSACMSAAALCVCLAGLGGCASVAQTSSRSAGNDPVAEVARWMAGYYDSRDQAAADAGYYPISLAMVPIWPERRDARWLYVEQAMADTPDKPYRQRVYRLNRGADGEVLSAVFTIDAPARFVQGWRNGALSGLTEAMLQPRAGCTVSLRRDGAAWRGATIGRDCASDLRGAAYATAEVTLDASTMRSWDRGYDAAGKQVWGAVAGAYVFVKRADEGGETTK
jgi:CpeT/CpcT family (DUF1001)